MSTVIDTAKRTVDVVVPLGTGSFTPDISVSGVSVSPASGVVQTLVRPPKGYLYTVTAADGSTAEWTVTVRWKALASLADAVAYLSAAAQAGTLSDPVPLLLAIDLSSGGWTGLLSMLDGQAKKIALDLTDCDMGGTEFNPDYTTSAGKDKIVTLTLPKEATSIKAGDYSNSNSSFKHFTALTELQAPAVETVGDYAFLVCTTLATVSLPAATTIGILPFRGTGSLALTLGAAVPTLEINPIGEIYSATSVTVKVPSGVTAWDSIVSGSPYAGNDTSDNWGNGFRGGGWDGAAMTGGAISEYMTLSIETYTP
ncbi:MAG: leucine-rich repeat domain-containing protein [Treponema sp.]|nr:leucine-rich repeat domain-containing protein [Treponema sp.]